LLALRLWSRARRRLRRKLSETGSLRGDCVWRAAARRRGWEQCALQVPSARLAREGGFYRTGFHPPMGEAEGGWGLRWGGAEGG